MLVLVQALAKIARVHIPVFLLLHELVCARHARHPSHAAVGWVEHAREGVAGVGGVEDRVGAEVVEVGLHGAGGGEVGLLLCCCCPAGNGQFGCELREVELGVGVEVLRLLLMVCWILLHAWRTVWMVS